MGILPTLVLAPKSESGLLPVLTVAGFSFFPIPSLAFSREISWRLPVPKQFANRRGGNRASKYTNINVRKRRSYGSSGGNRDNWGRDRHFNIINRNRHRHRNQTVRNR